MHGIVADAALMLVLVQKLRRRLTKCMVTPGETWRSFVCHAELYEDFLTLSFRAPARLQEREKLASVSRIGSGFPRRVAAEPRFSLVTVANQVRGSYTQLQTSNRARLRALDHGPESDGDHRLHCEVSFAMRTTDLKSQARELTDGL
jgi:hypothetical protein